MTAQRLILAIDIGTSGARAVLFDDEANHLSRIGKPYDTIYPQPGWSEQAPDTVVEAVIDVLKQSVELLPSNSVLQGIVLSSQMYSVLALDRTGVPLSNSLTWGDTRSAELAAMARRSVSPDLLRRTGCPLQAIYPLAKILWLKANLALPDDVRFVSIKDYVVFRLTGQLVADWSTASASGLLNVDNYTWNDDALAICKMTSDNLPELVSTRHILRRWRTDVSDHIGVSRDLPLIMGAGDAPLANIGVGAIGSNTLAINIGTSAAARFLTSALQVDTSGRLWTYVADIGHWVIGGIIGSGGAVYEWLLKGLLFANQDVPVEQLFQQADRLAASVPPGAGGLLFIPYFSGEQSPDWNPKSRGLVYGMTFGQEPRHYIRAAIEGIIFSLLRVAQPIAECRNGVTETIYLTGGLANSPVWSQTIADVFRASVVVPRSSESSARGAAILGWLALGLAQSYEAFAQAENRVQPDIKKYPLYQQRYAAFSSLNRHLQQFLTDQEVPHD